MLKNRIVKLALAAVMITSALGVISVGGSASAATTPHSAMAVPATRPVNSITKQSALNLTAVPDTASNCTWGSSSGNVKTCFGVVGGNNYVAYMWVEACVYNSGRWLHLEISGPGLAINDPSGNVYVAPGTGGPGCFEWAHTFNRNVTPAAYYGTTWRWNGGTSYTNIGEVGVDVLS